MAETPHVLTLCDDSQFLVALNSLKLAQMTPRMAIQAAEKEMPDSVFLIALANTTLQDPRYRQAGVAKVFLQHILTRQKVVGRTHWEFSLSGLANVYASIYQKSSSLWTDSDLKDLQLINSSFHNLIEVIHKDLAFLKQPPGPIADSRRYIVTKLLDFGIRDAELKLTMYDPKTMDIAWTCWLEHGTDTSTREEVVGLMIALFSPEDSEGIKSPEDHLDIAFRSVKINHLTSKINYILKQKTLIGKLLDGELQFLTALIRTRLPFTPHFIQAGVPKQVALACRRQIKSDQSYLVTEGVLSEGELFMNNLVCEASDIMSTLTDIINNTCIFEVAVVGLLQANRRPVPLDQPQQTGTFYTFFDRIVHCMNCYKGKECDFHATPEFVKAAKACLERHCIPTLVTLQEEANSHTGPLYLQLWGNVCVAMGITEGAIRKRYQSDRKCCNLKCPNRQKGIHLTRKSFCTECTAVFYCDRVCQKSDWKYHKVECRKLAESKPKDI